MSRRPRPRYHGVCAICDNTNATTQLCRDCKKDAANAGWVESWEDSDEGMEARAAGVGLASIADRKQRQETALQRSILDLATRGAYEAVPYFDARGHRHGTRMRYVPLSFREIARRLGCSEKTVRNVVKKQVQG